MTPEQWIEHYRHMGPKTHTIDANVEGMILHNLEECIRIVDPPDAEEIRAHVKRILIDAPYTRYCGD